MIRLPCSKSSKNLIAYYCLYTSTFTEFALGCTFFVLMKLRPRLDLKTLRTCFKFTSRPFDSFKASTISLALVIDLPFFYQVLASTIIASFFISSCLIFSLAILYFSGYFLTSATRSRTSCGLILCLRAISFCGRYYYRYSLAISYCSSKGSSFRFLGLYCRHGTVSASRYSQSCRSDKPSKLEEGRERILLSL